MVLSWESKMKNIAIGAEVYLLQIFFRCTLSKGNKKKEKNDKAKNF